MTETTFDLFLAHNSDDKEQIRAICRALRQRGLTPWFDEEQILAGSSFQTVIQAALPCVRAAAVFVGHSGMGNWQAEELQALLDLCKKSNKPIFLVLLPGVEEAPGDFLFLKQRNWVSFKNGVHDALHGIESAVRGAPAAPFFDVLLCYSEMDVREIRTIESLLRRLQVKTWKDGLNASALSGKALGQFEKDRDRIASMAVFVGIGPAPWEQEIVADIIVEFREQRRPVIPVILGTVVPTEPFLPVYLRRVGRVDFRLADPAPLDRLLLGIAAEEVWAKLFKIREPAGLV